MVGTAQVRLYPPYGYERAVIASEAKQSIVRKEAWIASSLRSSQ